MVKVYCKSLVTAARTSRVEALDRVPLTVSVDWLPDGTIKPRVYRTPDGTCYQVVRVTECVPLAFLKERGEGLRFKVIAKVIETPEPCAEISRTPYETHLYFEDSRFCEKNIVDGRYGHEGKTYVPVSMDVFPDGDYELTYFWFHNQRYQIEKTCEVEPRGAFHAGGLGLWHKVVARRVNENDDDDTDPEHPETRLAALYYEINKWFVSVKS